MSSTGRGSPAAMSDFGRGDGTLTPVLTGSPKFPYSNLSQPSSQSLRSVSGRSTNGHSHQHSNVSLAASAVLPPTIRTPSGQRSHRHPERTHLAATSDQSLRATSPRGNRAASNTPHALDVPAHRFRPLPRMAYPECELVPPTQMYWSKAPVWGTIPNHGLRAHSATLIDNMVWIFGGCDERICYNDIWLYHTETNEWSHPSTQGDIPPPCRAHTATLVDHKIVIFGGGEESLYYNTVYVLDTITRRWSHVQFPPGEPHPKNRRAHTAVLYRNKIWVYGGGNGTHALDDLWTLTVNVPLDKMRWEKVEVSGRKPTNRGYHTANIVDNVMVVLGGSDGSECFSDIWCLNLDTLVWRLIQPESKKRRLAHSCVPVGSHLLLIGGHDGSQYTSDVALFNFPSANYENENRSIGGIGPTQRGYHTAILSDSRIFVFGGYNGSAAYEDVYILDLAGSAYLAQILHFGIGLGPQ